MYQYTLLGLGAYTEIPRRASSRELLTPRRASSRELLTPRRASSRELLTPRRASSRELLRDVRYRVPRDDQLARQLTKLLADRAHQRASATSSSSTERDDGLGGEEKVRSEEDEDETDDEDDYHRLVPHVATVLSPLMDVVPRLSFSLAERLPRNSDRLVVVVVFNLSRVRNLPALPDPEDWEDWFIEFNWMSADVPFVMENDLGPPPPLTAHDQARLRPLIYKAQRRFHRHSNVIAVIGGYAHLGDRWSGSAELLVFVHHKGLVPFGERALPRTFHSVPVHVYEGRYTPTPPRSQQQRIQEMEYDAPVGTTRFMDPLVSGVSIGVLGTASVGTLGAFVVDSRASAGGVRPSLFLLTNDHVVRDSTANEHPITQPAAPDYRRNTMQLLEQQLAEAVRDRGPRSEQHRLRGEISRVRAAVDPWPASQDERFVVAGFPTVRKLGRQQVRREDNTRDSVGVDMALCPYRGDRLIDVRITIPAHLGQSRGEHAWEQTHEVLPWDEPYDEDRDLVLKDGRSTGLTVGKPVPLTASINTQEMGVFLLTRGEAAGGVHYQVREDSPTLHNQYLVKHERSNRQFAVDGDSGSLCYLRDHREPWRLRPWALLHGVIASTIWSYAVLSPMQAVMAAMPPGYVLVSPQNDHVLGELRAEPFDDEVA